MLTARYSVGCSTLLILVLFRVFMIYLGIIHRLRSCTDFGNTGIFGITD